MAYPKWLQPIENVFRSAEAWFSASKSRFWWLFAGAVVVMGVLSAVILLRRHDTDWIHEPCGAIQWEKSRLPVPVYTDSTLPEDWIQPLLEGMKMVDPGGRLLKYEGRLALGVEQPKYTVVVEQWNDDAHGNTHHEVRADCKIEKMFISMPVLMLPGKLRVRVAGHELLHALGVGHSDWETHLSYRTATTLFPFSLHATEKKMLDDAYGTR
jgi:hypothetical protein